MSDTALDLDGGHLSGLPRAVGMGGYYLHLLPHLSAPILDWASIKGDDLKVVKLWRYCALSPKEAKDF